MWKYSKNLKILYEVPHLRSYLRAEEESFVLEGHPGHVKAIINDALTQERALLNERESKQVLEDYGIPTVRTESAHNEEEAVKLADQIGYPVVLKLLSKTITHKTEVGGVKLNLRSAEESGARFFRHSGCCGNESRGGAF